MPWCFYITLFFCLPELSGTSDTISYDDVQCFFLFYSCIQCYPYSCNIFLCFEFLCTYYFELHDLYIALPQFLSSLLFPKPITECTLKCSETYITMTFNTLTELTYVITIVSSIKCLDEGFTRTLFINTSNCNSVQISTTFLDCEMHFPSHLLFRKLTLGFVTISTLSFSERGNLLYSQWHRCCKDPSFITVSSSRRQIE